MRQLTRISIAAVVVFLLTGPSMCVNSLGAAEEGDLYSIGSPSAQEQYCLELVNRARMNPVESGEAIINSTNYYVQYFLNYFNVDTNLFMQQMEQLPSMQPLAFNNKLMSSANAHCEDLYTNYMRGTTGSDGSTQVERVQDQGYSVYMAVENTYSYAYGTEHGFATFEVSWGAGENAEGGMLVPPSHRNNIHYSGFREIGIGIIEGEMTRTNDQGQVESIGPQVVVQDFATQQADKPLLTGVAYFDFNTNGFYDPGEGIGGIRVDVPGSDYYAITTDSGGYTIPLEGDTTNVVEFSHAGLPTVTKPFAVESNLNEKIDLALDYQSPQILGSATPDVGMDNPYSITDVPGYSAYKVKTSLLTSYETVHNAEGAIEEWVVDISEGYPATTSDVAYAGSKSFHLAHPKDHPEDQALTLSTVLRPGEQGALEFYDYLGYATTSEVAVVEVSVDGGQWLDVWSRAGTQGSGDSSFHKRTISLEDYAGKYIQLRFRYQVVNQGNYYGDTFRGVGWYLDNIKLVNADKVTEDSAQTIDEGTGFMFNPQEPGRYSMRAAAQVSGVWLDFAPDRVVTAQGVLIEITRVSMTPAGQLEIDFELLEDGLTSFSLQRRDSVTGTWQDDEGAQLEVLSPDSSYRFTTESGDAMQGFFRVSGE
ncbi:MAG: hypothetical protein K9N48_01665 [Verrucomicrobia bacterium]|nr:hypothetical protein [Verrucomicrobiota bacterium]MCF7707449.1 hypothetical protein [Verrucomicrobiota bacterium]